MLGIKNVILAVLITAMLGVFYGKYEYNQGLAQGVKNQIQVQAQVDNRVQEQEDNLKIALAEGLKNLQVKNTTIMQKATKEVIREEIYKECKVPDEGVLIMNEALRGGM